MLLKDAVVLITGSNRGIGLEFAKAALTRGARKVYATLGWEQEYFVIDAGMANSRPDLVLTGRTVFGHSSAKGQQLDDHYFGSIPTQVMNFMKELEIKCMQ